MSFAVFKRVGTRLVYYMVKVERPAVRGATLLGTVGSLHAACVYTLNSQHKWENLLEPLKTTLRFSVRSGII